MTARACLIVLLIASVAAPVLAQTPPTRAERAVHDETVVLDTHFDTPANLGREGWSIMDRHEVAVDGSQVDYPRMVASGVDGGFFVIFTPQGQRGPDGDQKARDAAILRGVEIHEMVAANPQAFEIALTPDQATDIARRGKRFVFLSMENGNPFGRDLSLMKTFHAMGVRMMGPIHFANNELGDSATDPRGPEWSGLSPLGRQFVAEANRLGVVIDPSHSSDQVLDQILDLSTAPVILSHTGAKAVFSHPRNIDDRLMKKVADKGGVIHLNAFSNYMITPARIAERDAAMADLMKRMARPGRRTQAETVALVKARREIEARWPVPRATFDDFMKHVLHAIAVAGVDHVGMSGDFDGGGGVEGLDDITAYPKITAALLRAGYSKADIGKFWGGNALRVMREAQAKAEKPAS